MKICDERLLNPESAPKKRHKYKKMHARAKDYIDGYLESAKTPVLVPELRHSILQDVQLRLSKSMLTRYLK